jgi:hypothetical protein
MNDTLKIFGREFTNVAGFKATDDGGNVLTYRREEDTISGETVYTSSTGKKYTETMIIDMGGSDNAYGTLSAYGNMEHLVNLTLTGAVKTAANAAFPAGSSPFSIEKYPNLKRLTLAPTEVIHNNESINYIKAGHYVFNNTNLTELVLGRFGGPYWDSGGYFRNDCPVPPGITVNSVGSTDGLHITAFVDKNMTSAGFMKDLATNTTVKLIHYSTGDVITTYDGDTSGGITPTGTINITTNGTHDVTNYASANVAVPSSSPTLQSKTATPSEIAQTITADSGYDGLSSVAVEAIDKNYIGSGVTRRTASDLYGEYDYGEYSVNVPKGYYDKSYYKAVPNGTAGTPTAAKGTVSNYSVTVTPSVTNTAGYITGGTKNGTAVTVSASELVSGTKSISENGTGIDVTNYSAVDVNVEPNLQSKSATPTESSQTVTADSGYDGLSSVSIGAISKTYVGSEIAQRDGDDLTASGATVTVPSGYYAEQETKSVATATHANPTASVNSTTGLVTASHTQAAGYVSAGTTTGTLQLTTQAAATITPSTSEQTAVAAGKYTTGAVKVAAMPSGSAGTPSASKGTVSNHSITVTPSVTNTTGYISGGTKYGTAVTVTASELVSGSQTITANGTVDVTNLASVNVALTYSTVTVSSSSPSGGNDGDIWIKQ